MYYNKELYVNEEIKAREKRLCKLQTVLVLSISGALIAAFLACAIPLWIILGDEFKAAYVLVGFGSAIFALLYAVLIPTSMGLDILRERQTEELKGKPVYDKYAALLQAGRKLNKANNGLSAFAVAVGLVIAWVLSIVFPYNLYAIIPFLFISVVCNLLVVMRNGKEKQIKAMEAEITQELLQEQQ